jgi:hypothetical protein
MGVPHRQIPQKAKAHPAHPTPPAHFQPPVTPTPLKQFEDPRACISDLNDTIHTAATRWRRFAYALGGAYTIAWHAQGSILKQVKENLETRAKKQEADAMFALSLLTVGLGGALAGACVKKVIGTTEEQLGKEFVEKWAEKWGEKASEKGGEFGKIKAEWLTKHLYHPPAEEAFSPAGVEPLQYQDAMLEGIEYRTGTLEDLTQALKAQLNRGESLDNLPSVYNSIVSSPFIASPPSLHISAEDLKMKALLALWLSWGWGRDVAYWRVHSVPAIGRNEAVDFEPVHRSLIQCGVPESRIGQQFIGIGWGDVKAMQKSQGDKDWDQLTMINMSKFIEWCTSNDCIEVLFHGLPIKSEWFQEIKTQVQLRRALGPYARYLNQGGGE